MLPHILFISSPESDNSWESASGLYHDLSLFSEFPRGEVLNSPHKSTDPGAGSLGAAMATHAVKQQYLQKQTVDERSNKQEYQGGRVSMVPSRRFSLRGRTPSRPSDQQQISSETKVNDGTSTRVSSSEISSVQHDSSGSTSGHDRRRSRSLSRGRTGSSSNAPIDSSEAYNKVAEFHRDYSRYQRPQTVQSESGAPTGDHDRFLAYVNRFSILESSSPVAEPQTTKPVMVSSPISERIRQYNSKYPEPHMPDEHQHADHLSARSPSFSSGDDRSWRSSFSTGQRRRQQGRDSSREPVPSDEQDESVLRAENSLPPRQDENSIAPGRRPPPVQTPYTDPHPITIETPSPARVQDLKRRLWDGDETLQVAVPPTLPYAQLEHYYQSHQRVLPTKVTVNHSPNEPEKCEERASRSLSPDREGCEPKPFKSKFYEAAMASRVPKQNCQPITDSTVEVPPKLVEQSLQPPVLTRTLSSGSRSRPGSTVRETEQHISRSRSPSADRRSDTAHGIRPPRNGTTPSSHDRNEAALSSNVALLVARLNAVRRDDPQAALAQIDSILRQESRSSGGSEQKSSKVVGATEHGEDIVRCHDQDLAHRVDTEQNNEDLDSDDETTVSSITNPTYQGHNHVAVHSSTAAFRRPRPSALQTYTPAMSGTNAENSNGPLSKSKQRRQMIKQFPPPATIKVKSPKSSVDGSDVEEEKKEEVDDDNVVESGDQQEVEPIIFNNEPNITPRAGQRTHTPTAWTLRRAQIPTTELTGRPASATAASQSSTPRSAVAPVAINQASTPTPKQSKSNERKLDKYMANSAALAEKIRAWDELSNSVGRKSTKSAGPFRQKPHYGDQNSVATSPVLLSDRKTEAKVAKSELSNARASTENTAFDSERISSALDAAPLSSKKLNTISRDSTDVSSAPDRSHPWDTDIPVAREKTQVKNTSMDNAAGVEVALKKRPERSGSPVSIDISQGEVDIPSSSLLVRSPSPLLKPTKEKFPDSSSASLDASAEERSAPLDFDVDPELFAKEEPKEGHDSPVQQDNVMNMSEDFDAAWVSMPASSFFPKEGSTPPRPKKMLLHSAASASDVARGPSPAPRKARTPTLGASHDEESSSAKTPNLAPGVASAPNTPQKAIPIRRARSFNHTMNERSIARTASTGMQQPNGPPTTPKPVTTPNVHSKRRGFLRNAFKRKTKRGPIVEPASTEPVSAEDRTATEPSSRGRASIGNGKAGSNPVDQSVSRSRSQSTERFRSARMAQKFNRVMKLYDKDQ